MNKGNSKKPNILFFFTDQQRWDTVGCYGNTMNLTPNLDKIASEGVKFENSFTCQPVCAPARACIQTGTYATENGVFRNMLPLDKDKRTIAHILKESGYETGYIGKWHLAVTRTKPVPKELRGGYDYWLAADALEHTSHPYEGTLFDSNNNPVSFKKYRVDALTDYAIDYLDSRTEEKPFFLFLSFLEPHHQNDWDKYKAPDGYSQKYSNYKIPGDLENSEDGNWKESLPEYYGICKSIDENLGRIYAKLYELGILDNTIIVYTSDHGSHFKTRNTEYKRSCHEGSIRIPMIIRGPGFSGGKTIDDIASIIDLPPTLLDAGDAKIPEYMKGRSLLPLVNGTANAWTKEAFIQISESQVGRAIRTKRWKYSVVAKGRDAWNDCSSDIYTEEFLYDLENDPYEKINLIGNPKYRDICNELSETLKRRMLEALEKVPIIIHK